MNKKRIKTLSLIGIAIFITSLFVNSDGCTQDCPTGTQLLDYVSPISDCKSKCAIVATDHNVQTWFCGKSNKKTGNAACCESKELPGGSWEKSCGGGSLSTDNTNTFTAYCSTESSDNWICQEFYYENPDSCPKSTVDLSTCASFSFHNHKGKLICD
jgi:hypothetical protein